MEDGMSRLQRAEEEVSEVKDIMLDNLQKANERSGKLEDLESRAEDMLVKSKAFEKTTQKVKQKKQWQNRKWKVVLCAFGAAVVLVILAIIIFYIVQSASGE